MSIKLPALWLAKSTGLLKVSSVAPGKKKKGCGLLFISRCFLGATFELRSAYSCPSYFSPVDQEALTSIFIGY